MAKKKLRYPKSQISEPRIAKPGEFVNSDGTPYDGPVFEANGITFPGVGPNKPPAGNDKNQNQFIIEGHSLRSPQAFDESKEGGIYHELTNAEFSRHTEPIQHMPRPTRNDYKKGAIRRFFVQKKNERKTTIIEINKDQYYSRNYVNKAGINGKLWEGTQINWSLDPVDNYAKNLKALQLHESQVKTFIGLRSYLSDLRELAKTRPETSAATTDLYTNGNEFRLPNGRIYVGPYHIHPGKGPMVGAVHINEPHDSLTPIEEATKKFLIRQDTVTERTYPDGQKIPKGLPSAYKKGANQLCSNCIYFHGENFCAKWGEKVRGEYWCETWRSSVNPDHVYKNDGHIPIT